MEDSPTNFPAPSNGPGGPNRTRSVLDDTFVAVPLSLMEIETLLGSVHGDEFDVKTMDSAVEKLIEAGMILGGTSYG